MDLPDDERQLLAGYARIIGEIDAPKVYRISALRHLLSDFKAEVREYPHDGSSDDSADVKVWAERYFDETERTKVANKHLAERKLITLVHHQSEKGVVVIGLTLAGYDLGRELAKTKSTINSQGTTMDVLISWSKNKSRQLARELREWLPKGLPDVKPWMSEKDIDKGTEWFGELQTYLGQAKACIIVVTQENLRSPWLYYEAGAIAAKGPDVRICPYLVGVEPVILSDGPLGKFQCTAATKDDTLALVLSLNKRLGSPHNEQLLRAAFAANWPTLEAELGRVTRQPSQNASDFVRTSADEIAGIALSAEATMLLLEAAQDPQGIGILDDRDMAGTAVSTNGKSLCEQGDPRSAAAWTKAVADLVELGLLEKSGDIHAMTDKGYKVADTLKGKQQPAKPLDEDDITSMLESYLAQNKSKLTSTTFRFDEMESQLNLPPGSATKHIDKAAETLRFSVRRKGGNTVTFNQVFDAPQVVNFDSMGRPRRY